MSKTQKERDDEWKEAGMPPSIFDVTLRKRKTVYVCKQCNKQFKTLKGMRLHYFKVCGHDRRQRQ